MKYILSFLLLVKAVSSFAQAGGTTCSNMVPICTSSGLQFTANANGVGNVQTSEPGNDYGCLGISPNPSWYYFEIAQAGDIVMSLSAPTDIDFIIWGPYTSLAAAQANCGNHTNIVPNVGSSFGCTFFGIGCDSYGCSYDLSANETPGIPNAQVGEVYVMLITNYANNVQNITLTQTGGTGATDCSIVDPCNISALSVTPTACNSSTNTYDVSGSISFTDVPTTGTLTITDCHGNDTVISAPFTSPINYSINGMPSDGSACDVTAVFSDAPLCTFTTNYTAPAPCLSCNISSLTVNNTACNSSTNTYDVNGSISFTDAPTTGTLTITDCHGNDTVISAPFTSPINYSINGMPSDGSACDVTAVFSNAPFCTFTTNYTAPVSCLPCNISALSVTPTTCSSSTNTYDVSGSISFTDAPTTGTLTITDCHGNDTIINAPFTTPISYSINGIPSDGAACDVTAVFSNDPSCTFTANYTAPVSCLSCNISSLTVNNTACNSSTNTYDVDGLVSFISAPTTGTLTITDCHGNDTIINAPFTSPISYSINGIIADGSACGVTAVFSDDPSCTLTSNYTAPDSMSITLTHTSAGCNTDDGTATVNVSGGSAPYNYLWSVNNQNTATADSLPAGMVSVIVTDANGCSVSGSINIDTANIHTAVAGADPTTGIVPLSVNFSNNSQNTTTYVWDFGDGTTSTDFAPTHTYLEDGTYVVVLTSINLGGCVAYDTLIIDVVNELIIPNVFTPNGDGVNDNLVFKNLHVFPDNKLVILNRWGKTIFEKTGYQNDWDGENVSDGTYFFVLELNDKNNTVHKGTISILRD